MSAHHKITTILLALSLSSSLSSCDGSKNPSKENFTRIINESTKTASMCLHLNYYPHKFNADELAEKDNSQLKANNALEKLGLLTSKQVEYIPQYSQSDSRYAFAYILGSKKQIGREFTLTDKGKKHAKLLSNNTSQLCSTPGAEVSRIMNFTEPADKDGEKITNVTYRYKYKNIDEWAKDPDVMAFISIIKDSLNKEDSPYDPYGEMQVTRTFKLTNEGWLLVGKGTF
jgi:hypothetical protein